MEIEEFILNMLVGLVFGCKFHHFAMTTSTVNSLSIRLGLFVLSLDCNLWLVNVRFGSHNRRML